MSDVGLVSLLCINNAYRATLGHIAYTFLPRPTNAEANSRPNAGLAQLGVLCAKRAERAKAALRTLRRVCEPGQIARQTLVAERRQRLAPDVLGRRAEGVVAKEARRARQRVPDADFAQARKRVVVALGLRGREVREEGG